MDREVYSTINAKKYVIQFQSENGGWIDTYPEYWSQQSAISDLNSRKATPYPYRVVERTP